jgi:hypothetical protein
MKDVGIKLLEGQKQFESSLENRSFLAVRVCGPRSHSVEKNPLSS